MKVRRSVSHPSDFRHPDDLHTAVKNLVTELEIVARSIVTDGRIEIIPSTDTWDELLPPENFDVIAIRA